MSTVYVLTTLMTEGGVNEWRPVSVVSSEEVANQWSAHGENNDWIPFEVDDLSLTGLSDSPTVFKPQPATPMEQRAVETAQMLEKANRQLLDIIEKMKKQQGKKAGEEPDDNNNISCK